MSKVDKSRLNLKIDEKLKLWAMRYARRHNTTITSIICQYFLALKQAEDKRSIEEVVDQI